MKHEHFRVDFHFSFSRPGGAYKKTLKTMKRSILKTIFGITATIIFSAVVSACYCLMAYHAVYINVDGIVSNDPNRLHGFLLMAITLGGIIGANRWGLIKFSFAVVAVRMLLGMVLFYWYLSSFSDWTHRMSDDWRLYDFDWRIIKGSVGIITLGFLYELVAWMIGKPEFREIFGGKNN